MAFGAKLENTDTAIGWGEDQDNFQHPRVLSILATKEARN